MESSDRCPVWVILSPLRRGQDFDVAELNTPVDRSNACAASCTNTWLIQPCALQSGSWSITPR
jgi:hypothetical protein